MANKVIGAEDIGHYPVLAEIQRQLETAGYARPFENGASLSQDIPGNGVLQVHFGSEAGKTYTLFVDVMEGRATALTEQNGCTVRRVSRQPKLTLDAAASQSMFIDLFGRFSIRRDYVRFVDDPQVYRDTRAYEQVKRYWDDHLLAADRTDGTSFPRRQRSDGRTVMGDGVVDNVDINAIAEEERVAPERVHQRLLGAITAFGEMVRRTMKGKRE